jgi:hypothetical protein
MSPASSMIWVPRLRAASSLRCPTSAPTTGRRSPSSPRRAPDASGDDVRVHLLAAAREDAGDTERPAARGPVDGVVPPAARENPRARSFSSTARFCGSSRNARRLSTIFGPNPGQRRRAPRPPRARGPGALPASPPPPRADARRPAR